MRIENHGFVNAADPRRVEQPQRKSPVGAVESSPQDEINDLLALSTGVVTAGGRQPALDRLAAAWREGAFRPDPARIADKLMQWGFDVQRGDE
jgi:hypothetical protein